MVANPKPEPDANTVSSHLTHITRRWHELGTPCLLEVVFLTAEDVASVRNVSHFPATPEGVQDAVEHITSMNAHRLNAYATVNPVSADNRPQAGKRSSASHIVASFFHWADADSEQAARAILDFVGPQSTFNVVTGTQPCTRPHVYWELEEPTQNLDAWRETQRSIAATLGTDPSVIDPPRIMRIGGTVNWPKPQKLAKGYIPEVTALRIYSQDKRSPVTSEQMRRAFTGQRQAQDARSENTFDFDTGEKKGKDPDEFLRLLDGMSTDGEKHGAVRDFTSSCAGQGIARALCEAMVRKHCPVWDENVVNLINTAYSKFKPNETTPNFDFDAGADEASGGWSMQAAHAFTADFVAPEYIIEGVVQQGRLYTLTAPTGSGKTAAMLYAAAAIATGMQFCGQEVEAGDVLFLAGENPDDVRARVIATLEFYGIDPKACRLHFIAGTFSIRADMQRLKEAAQSLPNLRLIVVDTFAAYFDGEDENSNAQVLDFARVVRTLTAIPSRPAVIMPAHPVKRAEKGDLTPKGGSSLVNEVDGNLTLWNNDGLIKMHWQVKHRGPDFEPLTMELDRYESDSLLDRKQRRIPAILAKPVLTLRAAQIAKGSLEAENALLLNIADSDALTARQRMAALNLTSGAYTRLIEKLADDKLIKKFRRKWLLTGDGKKAVEELTLGMEQPADDE